MAIKQVAWNKQTQVATVQDVLYRNIKWTNMQMVTIKLG